MHVQLKRGGALDQSVFKIEHMRTKTIRVLVALAVTSVITQAAVRVHKEVASGTTQGYSVITHVADGGGWTTTIVLNNLGTTPAEFGITFHGDSGINQVFPFVGGGEASIVTGTIPVGGQWTLQTADISPTTTTGWAFVESPSGGDIAGFAVFGYATGYEAVVPIDSPSPSVLLPFDNTDDHAMGIAVANPFLDSPANCNVVFLDGSGQKILSDSFSMTPAQHASFVLTDNWPALAGLAGTMLISSDSPITILGIRANSRGGYTTFFSLVP